MSIDAVCLIQCSAPKGIVRGPWEGEKEDSYNSYVSRRPVVLILIIVSAIMSYMGSGLEVCGCCNFSGSFYEDSHCFCYLAFL